MRRLLQTTALAASVCLAHAAHAGPPDPGDLISYQGQLTQGGSLVTNDCDFRFSLWNDPTTGMQVGPLIEVTNNPVANGVFTVQLDFGVENLQSEQRWLQIAVRCPAGIGAFISLDPRQPVTAAPLALHTKGIVIDAGGNAVVDGEIESTTGFRFPDGTVVTEPITSVQAGAGLLGGGTSGNVELSLDTDSIPGYVGDIEAVQPGPGLLGGGTIGSVQLSLNTGSIPGYNGDITAVNAGSGLTGGASSGSATLATNFGGNGSGSTVSHSNHWHNTLRTSSGTTIITVDSAQDVGIGTASPDAKLDINVGTSSAPGVRITQNDNHLLFAHNAGATKAGGIAFNNVGDSQGRFSIQQRTSSGGFEDTLTSWFMTDDRMEHYGDLTVTGTMTAGACNCPSDARLKTNVEPLTGCLAAVRNLRGVSYDWRHEDYPDREFDRDRQIGFIAQELGDVLPEVVDVDHDGYYALDYSRVAPVLVEAVKELDVMVATRDRRIAELEARLDGIAQARDTEVAALRRDVRELRGLLSNLIQNRKGAGE